MGSVVGVESGYLGFVEIKVFAGSAGIRKSKRRRVIARRAYIYALQRVTDADFEVVRDTGFEPVKAILALSMTRIGFHCLLENRMVSGHQNGHQIVVLG
jgi:hypothetical protein